MFFLTHFEVFVFVLPIFSYKMIEIFLISKNEISYQQKSEIKDALTEVNGLKYFISTAFQRLQNTSVYKKMNIFKHYLFIYSLLVTFFCQIFNIYFFQSFYFMLNFDNCNFEGQLFQYLEEFNFRIDNFYKKKFRKIRG